MVVQQPANETAVAVTSFSSFTNNSFSATAQDDAGGVETAATVPVEKKKKSKKKKKLQHEEAEAATGEQQQEEQEPEEQTTRLGKKALRKLRYQQTQLTPREFLWVTAKKLALSNHACILKAGNNSSNNFDCDSSSATPSSIRVVTTTSALSGVDDDDSAIKLSSNANVVTIKVQPLLVLDLNGILCHRIRHRSLSKEDRPALDKKIAYTPVIPRINLDSFLRFLDQHFCLAVWTSAKAKTAKLLLDALMPKDIASRLLFVYAQHHCNAIEQPQESQQEHQQQQQQQQHQQQQQQQQQLAENSVPNDSHSYKPVLFEKDLSRVWKEFPLWHSHNTLLYDDSPEKCVQWQDNAVHPPPLIGRKEDEITEAQQQQFVQQLAEHWKREPGVQMWHHDDGAVEETATSWSRSTQQVDLVRELVSQLGWKSNYYHGND